MKILSPLAKAASTLNHILRSRTGLRLFAATGIFLLIPASLVVQAQQPVSGLDRERGRLMLKMVKDDIKKNYYDPTFRGMDLEARFKTSEQKINEATSLAQVLGIIAQTLIELEDSHTFFIPPSRSYSVEYGWKMQMIGDKAYVVAVKPGSDAEAKGLKEGDEVFSIDGFGPRRENIWKINYSYHSLRPRSGVALAITKPDGRELQLDVMAKVKQGKRVLDLTDNDLFNLIRKEETESRLQRHRYVTSDPRLAIWKMPAFDLEPHKVDDLMGKFKKSKGLVLDLRGNSGGYELTLLRLIGNFFDREIKVGDLKRRKESKPIVARSRGEDVFPGKLVVLIDSESGSAAELFARVVQLEKRGTVIGDRSAGAVMRSKTQSHQIGIDVVAFFGVSVTDADIAMTDGKSLERIGVTPDETKIPTPGDLAAKRDPVLAYAVSLLGGKMTPEAAGALFPLEWKP